jgi:hypothetical protein
MSECYTRALVSEWGYATFQRGRVLCMRLDPEKVMLIEPEGGYMYLVSKEIEAVPMPDTQSIACALTGLKAGDLDAVSKFCCVARTMKEVEDEFPSVQAWRLRRLGLLRDIGKKSRRIVSVWAGYDLEHLLRVVYEMALQGTRKINNPIGF